MSEFWVSHKKVSHPSQFVPRRPETKNIVQQFQIYCKYCKIYIADDHPVRPLSTTLCRFGERPALTFRFGL